jgi:hypothetical protein
MTTLAADADQIGRFVRALFRYASPGTFVSLRAFTHAENKPAGWPFPCVVVGESLNGVIAAATRQATRIANWYTPAVFCPPVCTMASKQQAREVDMAEGLALSVECDQRPNDAHTLLTELLGPPTLVLASGGHWTNPETGEIEDKIHLHWRLREPTRDPKDHRVLKHARDIAAHLVGADYSGTPIVHPLRWAGSWHKKDQPRLALIIEETDNELELTDAHEMLVEKAGQNGRKYFGINGSPARPLSYWVALADGVDHGTTGRINAVNSIFGMLLKKNVEPKLAACLAFAYSQTCCRPALPEEMVWKSLNNIAGLELQRRRGKS